MPKGMPTLMAIAIYEREDGEELAGCTVGQPTLAGRPVAVVETPSIACY